MVSEQDELVETATVDGVVTEEQTGPVGPAGDDLAAVRDLVVAAHPDVVPEMIGGASVAEIVASVTPAREAYRRVVETAATSRAAPSVPAGNAPPVAIDPEMLPPTEKIRRGLASGR